MRPDQLKALEKEIQDLEAEQLRRMNPDAAATQPPAKDDPDAPTKPASDAAPSDPSDTGGSDAKGESDKGDAPEADDDVEKVNRRWEGRYKNLQSKMTKVSQEAATLRKDRAELTSRIEALEQALSERKPDTQQSKATLEQLADDYPDIMRPLLAHLSSLEERVNAVSNSSEADRKAAAEKAHSAAIAAVHSDWREVATSEDFSGWLERQTPIWQRVASAGTADEVIELLTRYKQEMGLASTAGPKGPTGADKARAAAEPQLPRGRERPSGGKRIWTREEIRKMSVADYAKHEAEIDLAQAEGRIR